VIRSPRPRKAADLSEAVHRQLNSYALAASAAGVGVLAFGQSAEARIVYTPTHVSVTPNDTVPLDLNNDGVADFLLHDIRSTTQAVSHKGFLSEIPGRSGNEAVGFSRFSRLYASALEAGATIGPGEKFAPGQRIMATIFSDTGARQGTGTTNKCGGPWDKEGNRYLGLKFLIQGETHFGWARLSVHCDSRTVGGTLNGYAYETIPDKPIVAGKTSGADDDGTEDPTTLGMLMLGRK
jgi:hypothetical protein